MMRPEMQEAVRIANDLSIPWGIARDIGEERAWSLIAQVAERVIGCPEKAR